jgi:hypothetical protein
MYTIILMKISVVLFLVNRLEPIYKNRQLLCILDSSRPQAEINYTSPTTYNDDSYVFALKIKLH